MNGQKAYYVFCSALAGWHHLPVYLHRNVGFGHSLNDNLHRNHLCKSGHIRYFVCARPTKTSARNCLARVIPSRRFNHRWPKKQHLSKISFSLNKLNSLLKYDLLFTEAATVELLSFRFSTFRSVRFPHCAETRPMFTRHVMFTSSEARWELLQMIRLFKSSTFTSSLQGLKDGKRVAFEQQGPHVSTVSLPFLHFVATRRENTKQSAGAHSFPQTLAPWMVKILDGRCFFYGAIWQQKAICLRRKRAFAGGTWSYLQWPPFRKSRHVQM